MASDFAPVIEQLVREIDGLRASIGPLMNSATFNARFNSFIMSRFLEENGELTGTSDEGEQTYRVRPQHFGKLRRIERGVSGASCAHALLPSSLLVTLVSRYDAFLGRLIRTMVLTRPELLKSSERSLSLDQLTELGDYDAAREFLIEKEIESVLRRSHTDHFDWLESKLDMPLRKDLPGWKSFIELTERRNLLVHCDGIISHQYLTNCRDHGVNVSELTVGEKLDAPQNYFRGACDCIIEMAVKLTHVVWRKLLPADREAADDALNNACFELIIHENYKLADELLRFASAILKKHASERHRLMYLVNWAQATKWLGDDEKCKELLEREDWSAKGQEFQICAYALLEDYDKTVQLMKTIGPNGAVSAESYREWPIFKRARKEKAFTDAYHEVFGEEMKIGENVVPVTQKQLEDFLGTVTGTIKKLPNSDDTDNDDLARNGGDSATEDENPG